MTHFMTRLIDPERPPWQTSTDDQIDPEVLVFLDDHLWSMDGILRHELVGVIWTALCWFEFEGWRAWT